MLQNFYPRFVWLWYRSCYFYPLYVQKRPSMFFLMKITLPPDILKLIELFANFILDSKLFDYLLVISQLPGSRALPATPAQLWKVT